MELVYQARKVLEDFLKQPSPAVDRKEVVAYATLEAFTSHFPLQACKRDRELIKQCQSIMRVERDRFYKQRRIALSKLAELHNRQL